MSGEGEPFTTNKGSDDIGTEVGGDGDVGADAAADTEANDGSCNGGAESGDGDGDGLRIDDAVAGSICISGKRSDVIEHAPGNGTPLSDDSDSSGRDVTDAAARLKDGMDAEARR
jgi:hypothetical protein